MTAETSVKKFAAGSATPPYKTAVIDRRYRIRLGPNVDSRDQDVQAGSLRYARGHLG